MKYIFQNDLKFFILQKMKKSPFADASEAAGFSGWRGPGICRVPQMLIFVKKVKISKKIIFCIFVIFEVFVIFMIFAAIKAVGV